MFLLKRRTAMDNAVDLSHLVQPNVEDEFVVVNKTSLEHLLKLVNTVQVHNLTVRIDPEKGTLWIWNHAGPSDGEGGEFKLDEFAKVVEEFYKENF
jgi:hypothetical protein